MVSRKNNRYTEVYPVSAKGKSVWSFILKVMNVKMYVKLQPILIAVAYNSETV